MNKIRTLVLSGTKYSMGIEYGKKLQFELNATLEILKQFFIQENNISLETLISKANEFYCRYPSSYQDFIKGISLGSKLSLDEVKILNAMETLYVLVQETQGLSGCAFLAMPAHNSSTGSAIIGRNYDFPQPYDKIARYLTVIILKESHTIPTAIIVMPGQIYCSTGINKESIFIALNNGMPSGGHAVNYNQQSLLVNMLIALQNSQNFTMMDKQLLEFASDYSLIINLADKSNVKSYEYSSFYGIKTHVPAENTNFVSTNFYLNETWSMPVPTDELTWYGVSRRNNLLKNSHQASSPQDIMDLLDIKLDDGGASWSNTIYQIVFDTCKQNLYLKRTKEEQEWTCIDLNKLFT